MPWRIIPRSAQYSTGSIRWWSRKDWQLYFLPTSFAHQLLYYLELASGEGIRCMSSCCPVLLSEPFLYPSLLFYFLPSPLLASCMSVTTNSLRSSIACLPSAPQICFFFFEGCFQMGPVCKDQSSWISMLITCKHISSSDHYHFRMP